MTETIGSRVKKSPETRNERERINSLTVTNDKKDITFFAYTDDGEIWGHRMEIATDDTHVVPADITEITENTDLSFIGCKDGSVMFESAEQLTDD
jgi:hypothetical protein